MPAQQLGPVVVVCWARCMQRESKLSSNWKRNVSVF